jgi:FlaA1/EpsC-like NDP-sugar epimerase
MPRLLSRTSQTLLDLVVLSLAFFLSFYIRFEGALPEQMFKRMVFIWPYVIGAKFLVLSAFGIPRFSWRYFGLREAQRVLLATATISALLLALRVIGHAFFDIITGPAQYAAVPIGVILVDFALAFLATTGIRATRRILAERAESGRRRGLGTEAVPTLLVGAGQAGLLVAKELSSRPDLGIRPIGFIDDDRAKLGTVLHGIRVLGTTDQLETLAARHGAAQILITIANAPGSDIRRINQLCEAAALPAKIIPGIYEIVGGQVNLSRIRNVSIEDLLGREAVVLEMDAISRDLEDQVVLVSGAGGSIGAELCRQVCRFRPRKLVLLEQAENSLFHIHRELLAAFPDLASALVPCIADVCDADRVDAVMRAHRPGVVFHAAAHKHVPMMEWNPGEAVRNNVFGTRTLADAAHLHRVSRFVMISTDKAVNPTSVMGATKRVAEMYVQALSLRSRTRFAAVRFGNVLGSAGSVIPLFQEQIARGGPVTVTHPEMRRYFMTIPEACQLVLQAGAMGGGGEIFILDMGEPVKIVDLARDLVTLSGLRPGEDIEIQFSGMRPGEKLFEELSVAEEAVDTTRHPKIFVGRVRQLDWDVVVEGLEGLRSVLTAEEPAKIRGELAALVPEYTPEADAPALAPAPAPAVAPGVALPASAGQDDEVLPRVLPIAAAR